MPNNCDKEDDGSSSERTENQARRYTPRRKESGKSGAQLLCRDIMTHDVKVATREMTLVQVAAMMRDGDTGVIPVVDAAAMVGTASDVSNASAAQGKLIGLITDRDIVVRVVAEGKDAITTRISEVMTVDVHTAQPIDRVIDVIRTMGDKQVRRIPVVDASGNLCGIISMADVALETEEDEEVAYALEEISSGASFWNKMVG